MENRNTMMLVALAIIVIVSAVVLGALVCAYTDSFKNMETREVRQVVAQQPVQPTRVPVQPQGICPITVAEGEMVNIRWEGTDPDAHVGPQGFLSYEYEGVIGEDGTWQTQRGDAGIHYAKARVFDGEFWDETELCVEVLQTNTAPKVVNAKDVVVYEGETVNLEASCFDAEGDSTQVTFDGWMNSATRTTRPGEAGVYRVYASCTDAFGSGDVAPIQVTVLKGNRPPMITWEEA